MNTPNNSPLSILHFSIIAGRTPTGRGAADSIAIAVPAGLATPPSASLAHSKRHVCSRLCHSREVGNLASNYGESATNRIAEVSHA